MESDVTFEEVAADVVAVVLIVLVLSVIGGLWVWGMALILGQVIRTLHYIRDGAPDRKYLRRMEAALFADNLTRAMEQSREGEQP